MFLSNQFNLKQNLMITVLFFLILFSTSINFQSKDTGHSVFVISNIIDVEQPDQFISRINDLLSGQKSNFTFIINGDIVDQKFNKTYEQDSIRIKSLLTALSKFEKGKFIIIPGERDWDNSGKNGLENVKRLESLVKSLKLKNVIWAIKNGCPGPNEFLLDENLLLITINTQWWNHPFEVPGPIDGECKVSTTDDFKEEFEDIINENEGKNILVAGHYPLISNGEYGGNFSIKKHIFPLTDLVDGLYLPLPFIGSFYPSFRANVGTTDDISNERFEETRKLLLNILSDYNSLVYISGHDKTQQITEVRGNYFVNSGAPESAQYAADLESSLLSESEPGILELLYHPDGKVTSTFHQFSESDKIVESEFTLFESACVYPESQLPVNYAFIPCFDVESIVKESINKFHGTTKVVAGPEYEAGSFKRFLLGDHYRDSWTTEIEVPYLDLDTTKGGLKLLRKGGGRQTLSLKFTGAGGLRYTFRSVNKDPIKALDYDLRKTFVANIVRDQTTTQHPYGALAADVLLNELDIIHAHPKLYVMPGDPRLGQYQRDFGGMLGMLEEDPENPEKGEKGYLGAVRILRSNKLFRELYNDHDNQVDAKSFAVARAFDILVGDWGKHDDNWKWIGFKEKDLTIYKPVPRDRDHVFSRWDGVLPWIADREWAKESGEDFNYDIAGLRSLMFQARYLDRFLASSLTKQDWIDAAQFIQSRISDNVIEAAVKNMPAEIYDISGKEIEDKLKVRIKDLQNYVQEYYEMISDEVDVVGSNKKEYFDVLRNNDGSVTVNVYNVKDIFKGDKLFYSRIFYKVETSDIRLYGLGGDDIFNVQGSTDESIKIRIISGSGADSINDLSNYKTIVYDKGKKTKVNEGPETQIGKPFDESLYNYDRTRFAYNTYFPLPYIYYGADDGFIFNFGIDFINHSFDKEDYSNKHHVQLSAGTSGSFGVGYTGRFHHVFGGWDFILSGHFDNPLKYTYFYGIGNETTKDDSKYLANYYRTRYNSKGLSLGLTYDYWKKSSISFLVNYENNERQADISNTIFSSGNYLGTNKINKIEGVVSLDIDFRNRLTLPTSGTRLIAKYRNGIITNLDNMSYQKFLGIAEGYTSFKFLLPLTFGLITGGGHSVGDIPFYEQFALGQNTYLKGYKNNRFTGTSMIFMQSELRVNLFG
ncbi:MAG: hypothetical protein Q8M94_19555, partial [Ignavibacteria bacterium]|nr:hypothetical protein [Ignavibacteria bacterium]